MAGQQFLKQAADNLTLWLNRFFERLLGTDSHQTATGQFTWADVFAIAVFLLIALAIVVFVSAVLRRKLQQQDAVLNTGERRWRRVAIETLRGPLHLFVWVWGLYFAFTPLALRLGATENDPLRVFADKAFDVGVFASLFWLFVRATRMIDLRLEMWAKTSASRVDDVLVPLLGRRLRFLVPLVALIFALPLIGLPPEYNDVVNKASSLLIIFTVAWLLSQAANTAIDVTLARLHQRTSDIFEQRKVTTHLNAVKRILYAFIAVFSIASALMLFEGVRQFGTSILASAGVAGIVVGFAAQRAIANVFAGIQLALTQPVRIGDAVVVEGEYGTIEEMTLSYVVIRIWDKRRLVVPLSQFIEKSFQNWTRSSTEIVGAVILYVDYTLPVDELRNEARRIVEQSPNWDRGAFGVQVTDSNERSMQIRVVATAADASKAWDLRCELREKLIRFIQQNYPQCLPRWRASIEGLDRTAARPRSSDNGPTWHEESKPAESKSIIAP